MGEQSLGAIAPHLNHTGAWLAGQQLTEKQSSTERTRGDRPILLRPQHPSTLRLVIGLTGR